MFSIVAVRGLFASAGTGAEVVVAGDLRRGVINPGVHLLASANSYGAAGWTAGGGLEYALTPPWSMMLE